MNEERKNDISLVKTRENPSKILTQDDLTSIFFKEIFMLKAVETSG